MVNAIGVCGISGNVEASLATDDEWRTDLGYCNEPLSNNLEPSPDYTAWLVDDVSMILR